MVGIEKVPLISFDEPETEIDWPEFNAKTKKAYSLMRDEPCNTDLVDIPSYMKL